MINFIKGPLKNLSPTLVIIETNGIGYEINISLNTFQLLQGKESVQLHIHFIVREDAQLLYGFFEETEKILFKKLISVSGVGAATALIMLSSINANDIANMIKNSDHVSLQKIKGIGMKTAQRIIIDLKDKVDEFIYPQNESGINNNIKLQALEALEVLGVSRKLSERIIDKVLKQKPESSLEELIKETLKNI